MKPFPHWCRDGHEEIGHSDSEHEQCPLCRANSDLAEAMTLLEHWKRLPYKPYMEIREQAIQLYGRLSAKKFGDPK